MSMTYHSWESSHILQIHNIHKVLYDEDENIYRYYLSPVELIEKSKGDDTLLYYA